MLRKSGFTLIELLVVVSIIAILSAIGLVTFSSVLKQGRDSKRQSDLRSIQSALEQYYADQFFYPLSSTSGSCPTDGTLKFGCDLKDPTGNRTYLKTIPTDPQSSSNYCYLSFPPACDNTSSDRRCIRYALLARLESQPPDSYRCGSTSDYNFNLTPP